MIFSMVALLLAVLISAANHSPIVQDEILAINAVASDFDFESASPNPGYVDKTSLWIGEKIPTFEVQNNSLYPLSISFYPILNENGVIVAHAMTSTIEGFPMAGISCQLVSSLNDFAKENSNPEFALIYDRDSVYAWGNNEIVLLAKNDFPIGIETRSYIEDVPTTYYSDIELAQLTPATKLNGGISCYSEDDESAYVRVPAVKQTTDSNCWAACMASILSVELGGNYTCDDLNSLLPSSSGATIPQVKNLFPTHFNINYSTFTASASDLSFNLLPVLNKLGEGHPLFGGFNSPAQAAGHAMVIRGINLGSNTYSAMDPATASYCSGTIRRATPNTGALLYAAPSAGLFSISPHTWVNFTAMKKSILVLLTISLISLAVLDASGSVEKTTAVEFVQYTTDGFIGREKYGLTHKEIEFTPKIGESPVIANSGDVLMVTYCKVSYGALDGVTCEPIKITKNYLSHIAHLR